MSSTKHFRKVLDAYLDVVNIDTVTPATIVCAQNPVGNIKAVLFDVYGTMLHNRLGEIGSDKKTVQNTTNQEVMFERAWRSVNQYFPQLIVYKISAELAMRAYFDVIKHHQTLMMHNGISNPDIDIVMVWHTVLATLVQNNAAMAGQHQRSTSIPLQASEVQILALLFEVVYNPVQLAAGISHTILRLRRNDIACGIISNAQFYTPIIFEYLLDQSLEQIGFDISLLFWSYIHQNAKPSTLMFELAKQQLAAKHIEAQEVLYIGNDMVNDIATAHTVGFKSCLYYGDKRSINLLQYNQRTEHNTPTTGIKSFDKLSVVLSLQ